MRYLAAIILLWASSALAQVTLPTHPTQVTLPITGTGNITAADGTSIPIGPFSLNLNTSGYTVITVCPSTCTYTLTQLQTAINAATCSSAGTIIKIQNTASISGNFTLPNHSCGAGKYEIITTDTPAAAPAAGVRIDLTYSGSVPKITASSSSSAVIQVADSSQNWILQNIEVDVCTTCGWTDFTYGVIQISDDAQTTTGQLPSNIILDRVIVSGIPGQGTTRGITMDGTNDAVLNSYITEMHETSADAQGIWTNCTTGLHLINNNTIIASTENFMSGGNGCTLPTIQANLPSDVTFTQNYLYKPESWRIYSGGTTLSATRSGNVGSIRINGGTQGGGGSGPSSLRPGDVAVVASCADTNYNGNQTILASPQPSSNGTFSFTLLAGAASTSGCVVSNVHDPTYAGTAWDVKNTFEMKTGKRYLVWGNNLTNCWNDQQSGRFIAINPIAQYGSVTNAEISDVEIGWNQLINGYGGFVEPACNGAGPYTPVGNTGRNYFHDNLAEIGEESGWYILALVSSFTGTSCTDDSWVWDHNTIIPTNYDLGSPTDMIYASSHVPAATTPLPNFQFSNNIIAYDSVYGVLQDCTVNSVGVSCWATTQWPNNIVYDSTGNCDANSFAPHAITCPVANIAAVGFTNTGTGNYLLTSGSIGHNAATDGKDVGVSNYPYLLTETAGAITGTWSGSASVNATFGGTAKFGGKVIF